MYNIPTDRLTGEPLGGPYQEMTYIELIAMQV